MSRLCIIVPPGVARRTGRTLLVAAWALAMGVSAANAQNPATQKSHLKTVLAQEPTNVDALLQYGMLLGQAGDYDAALQMLERGLTLKPDYLDLHIARARVLGYAGRIEDGVAEIRSVLDKAPNNDEAHVAYGQLLYYRGDASESQAAFANALTINPTNLEAQAGLDKTTAALQDRPLTRRPYDAASAPSDRSWRLNLGYGQSNFGRTARKPWHESTVNLSHSFATASSAHVQIRDARRSGQIDREYQIGIRTQLAPAIDGYVNAGITPGANFLPQHHVEVGGSWRVRNADADAAWGATVINVDTRVRHYATTNSVDLKPGVTQYIFAGQAWLNATWLNGRDTASGKRLPGWSTRADWQLHDKVRIFAGHAQAPEVDNAQTVNVSSNFTGLNVQLMDNLDTTLALSQERRERSYTRNEVTISLGIGF